MSLHKSLNTKLMFFYCNTFFSLKLDDIKSAATQIEKILGGQKESEEYTIVINQSNF